MLTTIAYEYIVPNNLVWAVVVPFCLILIQTGEMPTPFTLEFWLIAYFGFYLKCWPEVAGTLGALLRFGA